MNLQSTLTALILAASFMSSLMWKNMTEESPPSLSNDQVMSSEQSFSLPENDITLLDLQLSLADVAEKNRLEEVNSQVLEDKIKDTSRSMYEIIESGHDSLNKSNDELNDLIKDRIKKMQAVGSLMHEIQEVVAEIESEERKTITLNSDCDPLDQEIKRITDSISKTQNKFSDLKRENETLARNVRSLSEQISAIESKISYTDLRKKDLESSLIPELKAKIAEYDKRLAESSKPNDDRTYTEKVADGAVETIKDFVENTGESTKNQVEKAGRWLKGRFK